MLNRPENVSVKCFLLAFDSSRFECVCIMKSVVILIKQKCATGNWRVKVLCLHMLDMCAR